MFEDGDGSGVNGASNANTDEAFLLIQQITANIVSYCQTGRYNKRHTELVY